MADVPHEPADDRSGIEPDPRDDALARELAVEPLDELTRRRLVARALGEPVIASEPQHAGRSRRFLVAAAAALVVVLVVGIGVLASTSDNNSPSENQAFQRVPATTLTPQAAGLAPTTGASTSPSADAAGAAAQSAPAVLGDFGDLSTTAARRRLRAALAAEPSDRSTPFAASVPAPDACNVAFPNVVATATGTFGDRPAHVVVTRRANGSLRVRAVLTDTCEVRGLPSP